MRGEETDAIPPHLPSPLAGGATPGVQKLVRSQEPTRAK